MTTDVIDTSLHTSSFPATYTGPGTLIGNPVNNGGVTHQLNCKFTSDGNAVLLNLGFAPMHIKVINTTDGITWEWMYGMPSANSVKTVLGGSFASTQDTGSAFTISSDGNLPIGNVCSLTLSATLCGSAKNICLEVIG